MESLTFGSCITNSWKSTLASIRTMPAFFFGVVALSFLTFLLTIPHQADQSQHVKAWIGLPLYIFTSFVVVPSVYIKVCRFVVLGEGTRPLVPLSGAPLGRYLLLALAYFAMTGCFMSIILILYWKKISPPIFMTGYCLFIAALCFVIVRLSLLHVGIAMGTRLAFRAAWHDTRGRFWSLFISIVASVLPVWLVMIALQILALFLLHGGVNPHSVMLVTQAIVIPLAIVQTASIAAWQYRRFARELPATLANPA